MAKNNFTIRPCVDEDVGIILKLVKELAEYGKVLHKVKSTEEDLIHSLFGNNPSAEAIFAEVSGNVVGFAVFFRTNSTYVGKLGFFLEDLYVRPNYRGQGIGKALFMYLVSIANERGYLRIEWTTANWNQEAIDFYTSLGAVARSDKTLYQLDYEAIKALIRPEA